jgi:tetratricopeptide (TPR) repeat protein
LGAAICRTLREHILGGGLEFEHRHVAVGFFKASGVDRLLALHGPAAAGEAIDHAIRSLQRAALANDVTFLATDIGADGVKAMLCAGAPRYAGLDEQRLVSTLRAAVDAGGDLPLRAGATSGRVFCGDYGPAYRRTYSLMGDSVNLAARLMEHAGEGELLGSADLVAAVRGRFGAVAVPPLAVKGKRAAVAALRIEAPGVRAPEDAVAPPRSRGEEPLIGRERELEVLLGAARAAARGSGRAVELVGEPGIGKSRLLVELRERAPGDVLWVDGDIYAGARPYDPFQRLLRARWGLAADSPASALADRLRAAIRDSAPHLLPWTGLIAIVAGAELPLSAEVRALDGSLRKQRLEEVTSELLGLLLADGVTLIFNDVHLMDDASRDLIDRLAADAAGRPWLVLVSRRPDSPSPLTAPPAVAMELGPLSEEAAAALLRRATASAPLAPHRLLELTRRAAGNPLFLRELVAQLRDGGDPASLPRSVEGAIAARIDRLRTADRRILRSAAVIGMDVELGLLAEVLGEESVAAGGDVDPLHRLDEFLEPTGPRLRRFSHQLVREVAYEGLPYRRRTELHGATAAALERAAGADADRHAELLALHCMHGGRYAAAWRYARVAAQRAQAQYANVEAAESYRLALAAAAHLDDIPATDLAAVDAALGEICVELGELSAADRSLRRALRRVRDRPPEAARLQLGLARLRDLSGRHRAALRWTARAESTLDGLEGPEIRTIRAQLAVRRARNSYRRGRHADALSLARRASELARGGDDRRTDRRTLAEALEYADLCAIELGLAAGDGARRALAIYEELGDLGAEARVRNTMGLLAYHRGEWPAALEHYAAAERAYERSGRRWDAATTSANRAEILADQGRLQEARQVLELAVPVWRSVDAVSEAAFGEYQLGRIDARQGDNASARRRFDAAREHFGSVGELTEVVVVDALAAECLSLAGDDGAALAAADAALARAVALGGVASLVPLLQRVRGTSLLALGRRPESERALRAGLEAAREREAAHEVAFTLAALIDAGMAAGAAQESAWREEHRRLVSGLGIEPDRCAVSR